jgi:N,N'-diacetyllegionaminate synthase
MKIQIQDHIIGDGGPCFIIAEAGVNHNGDIALAKQLVDAAHEAGADAIKFQTFNAEALVTPSAEKADYQKKNDTGTTTQFAMLKGLELSEASFRKLSACAKKKGLVFLSTAFDDESIDLLIRLRVPAFKIPSGEITNIPCLEKIARQKKPVILSTGMATMAEIRNAVTILQENGCHGICLLQCTTSYPAPLESVNLFVMDTFRDTFHLPVGYSDHTEGIVVPIAAVARGACIVEKHITLDRTLPGPDHAASLEPAEFKRMVAAIRDVERALGSPEKKTENCEINNRNIVRKSIVAGVTIPKGVILTESMLALKRPGTGIEPEYLHHLVGKHTKVRIEADTLISREMIE